MLLKPLPYNGGLTCWATSNSDLGKNFGGAMENCRYSKPDTVFGKMVCYFKCVYLKTVFGKNHGKQETFVKYISCLN